MRSLLLFTILALFSRVSWTHPEQEPGFEYEEALLYETFPDGFVWGAATASYQVNAFFEKQRPEN